MKLPSIVIHHATAKSAAKHGLEIRSTQAGAFDVFKGETNVASGETAKSALETALLVLGITKPKTERKPRAAKPKKTSKRKSRKSSDDEDGEGEGDEDDGETKSVIKPKYRTKYQPHKMTNGDALANRLRKTFHVKNEDGKDTVDWPRFIEFAKANEVWVPSYLKLNPGMRRMNVINRLRAKVRNDHKIVWTE